MLSPRQRQICFLRDRLDHLGVLMLAIASSAVGFGFVGALVPVGREGFFALVAADMAALLAVHLRAARIRRKINELNFFA